MKHLFHLIYFETFRSKIGNIYYSFCPILIKHSLKMDNKMDELDFKILKILDKNCQIPYSSIAKSLALPLRNVSQRIENLFDSKVIRYFSVQFSYNYLGFRHYIGSINPPHDITETDFFKELQLIPEIYRIWELLDGSLTISFFCKDAKHLEEIINSIVKIGSKFNSYTETRVHIPADIPYSLTDWRIIFFLFKNSRVTKKEIASTLGISEKTVMRRLNRMINMNLIQFIPEINFEAIKGMITAVLSLETIGPSKNTYLKIKKDDSIKYWRNTGSVSPSIVLFLYGNSLTEIYRMYLKLRDMNDVKNANLNFIVRNWENSNLIEDAILENIQ